MTEEEKKRVEAVALFRYEVIADLIHWPKEQPGLYQRMVGKSGLEYEIPGTTKKHVAWETIRDWLKAYRQGGFESLKPKPRKDAGQSRAISTEVADFLIGFKEEKPELSIKLLIQEARKLGKIPQDLNLSLTTVHRLFSHHGLMEKKETQTTDNDKRRFAFVKAGELCMSDVMHGPAVCHEGNRKKKMYLISFLDDATRVINHTAFALAENSVCFLPLLKEAILRRGLMTRLFVDNGAAYRSHHLSLVCAKLGIHLIHASPYSPEAKGKIERWHRTVRSQLLTRLTSEDTKSLEAINRRLWAWVEGEYHQTPHRGLEGETPLDRWAKSADEVRYLKPEVDIDDVFLAEAKRKVQKDRTVSLHGLVYEVDAALVGCNVTLRFNPSHTGRPIQVWFNNKKIQDAKVVDAYANCFVKRQRPTRTLIPSSNPPPPPPGLRLSELSQTDASKKEGR